jgi:hypothetical protein
MASGGTAVSVLAAQRQPPINDRRQIGVENGVF